MKLCVTASSMVKKPSLRRTRSRNPNGNNGGQDQQFNTECQPRRKKKWNTDITKMSFSKKVTIAGEGEYVT